MTKLLKMMVALVLLQCSSAFAAGQAFTQSNFDALLKAGKPVVIHIHASWCPTCKAQDPILNTEIKSPEFKDVTFLEVNFDTEKSFLKTHNVSAQSTILVFKDGKEVGRSTGDTKQPSIDSLVKKSL